MQINLRYKNSYCSKQRLLRLVFCRYFVKVCGRQNFERPFYIKTYIHFKLSAKEHLLHNEHSSNINFFFRNAYTCQTICNKYNEENKPTPVSFVDCEFPFKSCICSSLPQTDLLIMISFHDIIIFIYVIITCNYHFYIIMILLHVTIIFITPGNREKDLLDGIGSWHSPEI